MNTTRVYDLPTRVFHWLFAGCFVIAYSVANLVDDESTRFSLHMLAGLGATFAVLMRLAWSGVGTQHARLGDLSLDPRQLLAYFKGIASGSGREWVGHNPASSWAAVVRRLQRTGYEVAAPGNPLRGLASDAAYLRSFLATIGTAVFAIWSAIHGATLLLGPASAGEGKKEEAAQAVIDMVLRGLSSPDRAPASHQGDEQ